MNPVDLNSLLEFDCKVEYVIFRNEINGYTVLEVKVQDKKTVAVGKMPWVNTGESLHLVGRWKSHHNFGMQFFVESYERFMPSDCEAIASYLSSGIIKGIGKRMAEKIVDKFGEETLVILENYPNKVCEINGISLQKANKISKQLKEIINVKNLSENLKKYEISPEETIKIYINLGENAIQMVEENPYILCKNEINLDFEKVDIIAQKMNKSKDDINRIGEGIIHILKHNMKNGHTCLPIEKLVPVASKFLNVSDDLVLEQIQDMTVKDKIKLQEFNEKKFVFTKKLYDSESYCAIRIKMMLGYPFKAIKNIKNKIQRIEKQWKIEYSESQKEAIKRALSGGIFVLTGGPGTGKTTTLRAIIEILEANGEKVFISAPTGRAAQRITELSQKEAQTIHRLLEVHWDAMENPIFRKNEENLLDCDALILDEASMVDLSLFEALIRALPLGARLIIVGDSDQLPSIGAGDILRDLISCGAVSVVRLKEIFRQSRKSLIIMNAHKIVCGEIPELKVKDNDFFFLKRSDVYEVRDTVLDLYGKRLPKSYNYNPITDIQILTPGRKGVLGTRSLNICLQEYINPKSGTKKEINVNGFILRENDKVMQTKNNYDIYWEKEDGSCGEGIFNGDIGIILEIDLTSSCIAIKYDDKIAVYELEEATNLELAYATTVHKSQGNEFNAVILPLFGKNPKLHYKNLLYTAVTRAKSKLIIVGSEETIRDMVKNDKRTKRYSGLKDFLLEDFSAEDR